MNEFLGSIVLNVRHLLSIFTWSLEDRRETWKSNRNLPEFASLKGKTILITGGNAGIGLELARQCAQQNARKIIITSRSPERGRNAIEELRKEVPDSTEFQVEILDLDDFESVQSMVGRLITRKEHVDVLVLNAGLGYTKFGEKSVDGFDLMFQSNVLGHVYLTDLWLEHLDKQVASGAVAAKNAYPRIIALSSIANLFLYELTPDKILEMRQDPNLRYSRTKLMNILHMRGLALERPQIVAHSVHPGFVMTNFSSRLTQPFRFITKSILAAIGDDAPKGTRHILFMVTQPEVAKEKSGTYWWAFKPRKPNQLSSDDKLVRTFMKSAREAITGAIKKRNLGDYPAVKGQ